MACTTLLYLLLSCVFGCVAAIDRTYYIGVLDTDWDYTGPSGRNEIYDREFNNTGYEADYVLKGPERIGSVYTKSVYRRFTNDTFSELVPHPPHLGILGPVLTAEVGDTIVIHFKNTGTFSATMHPHGVFYDKDSEGAIYEDGTEGANKADDGVHPGNSHTYRWVASERAGPTKDEDGCAHWLYHSHLDSTVGTNAGLLGPLLICRKGFLRPDGTRRDVDKMFFLMMTVVDENLSYHLGGNVQMVTGNPDNVDLEDDDFVESNRMRSINGHMFGSLPGLDMCYGDRVEWNVFATGTEVDVHSISFYGNILDYRGHKEKTISIAPASSLNAYMVARSQGTWLLTSDVTTHVLAGMQALYHVNSCGWTPSEPEPLEGAVRRYYIAAVERDWDYTGSMLVDGRYQLANGDSRPEVIFFNEDGDYNNGSYRKALYREFTDETFATEKARSTEEEHLGFLGPVIRAEVGDTIEVVFRNNASRPYSIHPSGVHYDKANEGAFYNDNSMEDSDDAVAPGASYTYSWTIPDYLSPTDLDEDCILWLYRSHVDPVRDAYSGLIGPLLLCKSGTLGADRQIGVDAEFFLLFMNFDESLSHYRSENMERYIAATGAEDDEEEFMGDNQIHAINGHILSTLPGLEVCAGDDVMWHLASFGKETDMHMAVFEQQSMVVGGLRRDQANLFPGTSRSFVMNNIHPGDWNIYCNVATHYVAGTQAMLIVKDDCGSYNAGPDGTPGNVYYFTAEEIEWDYAPVRYDPVASQSLDDPESPGNVFVRREGPLLGSKYKKAVYRQYEDDTFATSLPREESWGILGNPIYAEVGEKFDIVFRNQATRPYGFYIHGVEWVNFNRSVEEGGIAPGQEYRYTFMIPEGEGLSPTEADCAPFIYTSTVDIVKDVASGLVGPLVVCRKGVLSNGRRTDVAKELFLLFTVLDENKSWYLDENIEKLASEPVDKSDGEFEESNLMHGINGMLYSNLKGLEVTINEPTEWYLLALGDEVDLHTVHFHGHTVVYRDEREHVVDVYELAPGITAAVRMIPDDPGVWLLHCHVNDHIIGGMEALYSAKEPVVITEQPMTTAAGADILRPITAALLAVTSILAASLV